MTVIDKQPQETAPSIKRDILKIPNAYSNITTVNGGTRAFGIFDAGNSPVKGGALTGKPLEKPLPPNPKRPALHHKIDAPLLFGGLCKGHFGHSLTCNLGRLWALDQLPPETVMLYAPIRDTANTRVTTKFARLLGLQNEFIAPQEPVSSDAIYIAPDLYGEVMDGRALPDYADWLRYKLRDYMSPQVYPGSKLYISRTRLVEARPAMAAEKVLEDNLARNGFEIFYPEDESLEEQFQILSCFETIVALQGSALHVQGFVKQRGQKVVTILSREEDVPPPLLRNQPTAFEPSPTFWVIVPRDEFVPKVNNKTRRYYRSIVDFALLREALLKLDVIDPNSEWREPSQEEIEASFHVPWDEVKPALEHIPLSPEILINVGGELSTWERL